MSTARGLAYHIRGHGMIFAFLRKRTRSPRLSIISTPWTSTWSAPESGWTRTSLARAEFTCYSRSRRHERGGPSCGDHFRRPRGRFGERAEITSRPRPVSLPAITVEMRRNQLDERAVGKAALG